jgi:hypothetical protein
VGIGKLRGADDGGKIHCTPGHRGRRSPNVLIAAGDQLSSAVAPDALRIDLVAFLLDIVTNGR